MSSQKNRKRSERSTNHRATSTHHDKAPFFSKQAHIHDPQDLQDSPASFLRYEDEFVESAYQRRHETPRIRPHRHSSTTSFFCIHLTWTDSTIPENPCAACGHIKETAPVVHQHANNSIAFEALHCFTEAPLQSFAKESLQFFGTGTLSKKYKGPHQRVRKRQ